MKLTTAATYAPTGSEMVYHVVDCDALDRHCVEPADIVATYKTQREADLHVKRAGHGRAQGRDYFLRRYPRLCAHIIAESLGYATPSTAAMILRDAHNGQENWCEWIHACYGCRPEKAVRDAIRSRHRHTGYMAEYRHALALVQRANRGDGEPLLASWF